MPKNKKAIRIEPRLEYDKAILKTCADGTLVYSYYRLVKVTMKINEFSAEDATEWVDYNICQLDDGTGRYFKLSYRR
jgi:hypothetical protein